MDSPSWHKKVLLFCKRILTIRLHPNLFFELLESQKGFSSLTLQGWCRWPVYVRKYRETMNCPLLTFSKSRPISLFYLFHNANHPTVCPVIHDFQAILCRVSLSIEMAGYTTTDFNRRNFLVRTGSNSVPVFFSRTILRKRVCEQKA